MNTTLTCFELFGAAAIRGFGSFGCGGKMACQVPRVRVAALFRAGSVRISPNRDMQMPSLKSIDTRG